MVYPPSALPTNKTDATVQATDHAALHNDTSRAINDLVTVLGANPGVDQPTVQAMLTQLKASLASLTAAINPVAPVWPTTAMTWFSHRGGSNVAPENTLEAYRMSQSLNRGLVLECDVYRGRDGVLYLMHDATLDRTSTGTGSTSQATAPSIQRARVDAGGWFGPGWANDLHVPTFREFLREFGGRNLIAPEVKNSSAAQPMADMIAEFGLQSTTLVQSFTQADLAPAKAIGCRTMFLTADLATVSTATLTAASTNWVGFGAGTAAQINAMHAAGLKVAPYTVDRHVDRDAWLALGVDGMFTNEPLYVPVYGPPVSGTYPAHHLILSDPYATGAYYHGHLAAARNASWLQGFPRGDYSGTALRLDAAGVPGLQTGGVILAGWGCPIKTNRNANAFVITETADWDQQDGTNGWVGLFVCANTDAPFEDQSTDAASPAGYHCLFRSNGDVDIYKCPSGGASTQIATVSGSAWPANTARQLRVTVTATTIKAEVIGGVSVTATDSSYRGGYFHHSIREFRARTWSVSVA